MKTKIFLLLPLLLSIPVSPSFAELDLDQEVLIIPDTHNEKPYIWHVLKSPKDFELVMDYPGATAGKDTAYTFGINRKQGEDISDMHVFITDDDLHAYKHVRPETAGENYKFTYNAPWAGKYRFEIVFKTPKGWVNLRKDIRIKGERRKEDSEGKELDEGYGIKVKLIPKKIYSEHAGTVLYEISYQGKPLKELEKIDGIDMQAAAWDEDLKEFIYAIPRQNLGGPEVAVSFVFMRPGKHAIFAEFKHNGKLRKIDMVVDVLEELRVDPNSIENIKPSE